MYLLAADPPVQVPTSNPTYLLIGAAIGAVAGLVAALITSWRADRREHQSWRREQLGIAVALIHDKFAAIKKGIDHLPNMNRDQLLTLLRSATDDVYRVQLVSSDWFAGIVINLIEEMEKPIEMIGQEKRVVEINKLQSILILTAREELKKSKTSWRHQWKAHKMEKAFMKRTDPIQQNK
ncbi:hypothetical protein [Rhodococcus sp. JG-3]|uniref:hypothetical protein n=1 Tax=Rhodococcus sp. JG-3 TaxID=1305835 RepID=UPI001268E36C|nr:hypothetical protein [Rhodococcus sp. JG-3]